MRAYARTGGQTFETGFIRSTLSKCRPKMETRHPIGGSFGSEFPVISNHCVVMTAWSRKTWKCCVQFFVFFGKTTLYGKIFKMLFRKFTSRHRLTLCSNVVKFVWREMLKSCVIYVTKKTTFAAASQTVATARITLKICQDQPPTFGSHCSRFHPNRFTFGGVIAERVNTVLLPRRVYSMIRPMRSIASGE